MVGFEGLFGLIIVSILILILNFISCGFGIDACAYSPGGDPFIERADSYFDAIGSTGLLLSFAILGVFSIMVFNGSAVTVSKHISPLVRTLCDVTRTLVIWLVGIFVTATIGKSKENYKWESLDAKAIVLQSIGFLILICGNLIYNQILKVPCLSKINEEEGILIII